MGLEQTINAEIKKAMLARDEAGLRSLRAIKAALLLAKSAEGSSGELSADEEIKLLQKMVKQRRDSLDIYQSQNRSDLAVREEEEIQVISRFLPAQASEEELDAVIQNIIASTGASSMADMGKVMAAASKELSGKADGKTISARVKALLTKN